MLSGNETYILKGKLYIGKNTSLAPIFVCNLVSNKLFLILGFTMLYIYNPLEPIKTQQNPTH